MTAAFIHDHYFVYNNVDNKYYDGSGGVFDYNLWNRYLAIFDSITVIGREIHKLPNKLIVSSHDNVSFNLIDDIKSGLDRFTKYGAIKSKLKERLSAVDFAIIRVPSTLGYIAQAVCIEMNKPYLLEIVACPWDAYWNYGKATAKVMAPFEWLKLKSVAKKAPACVYVTKQFLQGRYPTNGKSIAISNVRIEDTVAVADAQQFYKQEIENVSNGAEFKVGLIGSFHIKYKGHTEALHALKDILEKGAIKNIKMYFVGTGDAQWVIDQAISLGVRDNVEIVGTVKAGKDGVLPFLDGIHLYIHPSKQEGLPRVVIEAMSRGKLTLGSSAAGIPELLDEQYLHTPGDWNKLSVDIISVYNNKNNWQQIASANITKANDYLEDTLQSRRVKFFNEAIKIK